MPFNTSQIFQTELLLPEEFSMAPMTRDLQGVDNPSYIVRASLDVGE